MIQLTGKLESIAAGTAEIGEIILQLHGYGSQIPRVSGTALLARVASSLVTVDPVTGAFDVNVHGNDAITPPGTYYTLKVVDDNGDIAGIAAFQVTGAGSLDITSAPPFDPSNIAPPYVPAITSQIVPMAWSATPVFNGSAGLSFEFPLSGNVPSSTFPAPVAGNLYTFILTQDATGGRTFAWPPTVHNPAAVSPVPNSITVQTFVARSDGSLDAIGGALYA